MIGYQEFKPTQTTNAEMLARQSHGSSGKAIYTMVAKAIIQHNSGKGTLIDVGCGQGNLYSFLSPHFDRYIGVDVVRYEGLPIETEFITTNLADGGKIPLLDECADAVCAVETIEHLENPRAFMRELVRLVKPGGLVIVTTPNQLSLLSKLTFILKNQFNAFQESPGLYPAHITALLEIDLIRIATECKLKDIKIHYSNCGRMPFTPWHWSKKLGFHGQAFSDNILCIGRKSMT